MSTEPIEDIKLDADSPAWAKLVVLSYLLGEASALLDELLRGDRLELTYLTRRHWEDWDKFSVELRNHLPNSQECFYSTIGGAR